MPQRPWHRPRPGRPRRLPAAAVGAALALACGFAARVEAAGTEDLRRLAPGLEPRVLELALAAQRCAAARGELSDPRLLTVIDYSMPSTEPRLWVLDLEAGRVIHEELVAHGKNTGENEARHFSNRDGSLQSSLGLFATGETYEGENGHSLRLHGLEPGVNDHAFERTIVIHGAWYVAPEFAAAHGRLGRSWGCPALRPAVARELIDRIAGGSAVFVYYPDEAWLASSAFLNGCGGEPTGRSVVAAGAGS